MTCPLKAQERDALDGAGFDKTVIGQIEVIARQTPWLAVRRWAWRMPVQISFACAAIPAALLGSLLVGSWAFTPLMFTLILLPYLIEGVWRMATAILDPNGRGLRTALALSVRAKPDGQGGAGFAFAQLKDLASAAQGLTGPEAVTALIRYQRKKDRHKLIAGAIMLGAGALFVVFVVAP